MHHYFLTKSNVTMFLNHSLGSIDAWHESISRVDQHITANGVAMKLIQDVANGSQTCQEISFNGNHTITNGKTTFPKLVGWKFNHIGMETGFICNFSKDTFNLSLNGVFTYQMNYSQFSADTNFRVTGISSLNKNVGNSPNTIQVLPYSFMQIYSSPTSSLIENSIAHELVYPNPSDKVINFKQALSNFYVLNSEGKKIAEEKGITNQLNTTEFEEGSYFIKYADKTIPFCVKH